MHDAFGQVGLLPENRKGDCEQTFQKLLYQGVEYDLCNYSTLCACTGLFAISLSIYEQINRFMVLSLGYVNPFTPWDTIHPTHPCIAVCISQGLQMLTIVLNVLTNITCWKLRLLNKRISAHWIITDISSVRASKCWNMWNRVFKCTSWRSGSWVDTKLKTDIDKWT